MDKEKRLQLLKNEITEAFKDIPYPGDNNIAQTKRDEYGEGLSKFKGKHWKDLGFDFLVPYHSSSMNFMTPQAFRFFLPAYLMVSVEFYFESDVLSDYTIADLTLPLAGQSKQWLIDRFSERFDPMTARQNAAIRLFLETVRDVYPNQGSECIQHLSMAIERYWQYM